MKKDFKDLRVWQFADRIFRLALEDFKKFPRNRIAYFLSDQFLRSIGSISANIAEGHGRGGDRELQRSLIIARGEIFEARSWLAKIVYAGFIDVKRSEIYEDYFFETIQNDHTFYRGDKKEDQQKIAIMAIWHYRNDP